MTLKLALIEGGLQEDFKYNMKIAFVSTRGIPNNYGGFEQFAEYISVGLVQRGHEVVVYSPHFHPFKESSYNGVRLKHIYSPEEWMGGSVGSFFYDFISFRDSLKKEDFDIIYVAGYTSIIPAYLWYNVRKIKTPIIVTNMDGLEYKRTKFNKWTRKFLFWEEKKAVRHSAFLIADNLGIRDYYKEKYGKESEYLAYGADIYSDYDAKCLTEYNLAPNKYNLLIARLEPENNVEMVVKGYINSDETNIPLVIVGKTNTRFGKYLVETYGDNPKVIFLGGIYDFKKINSVRFYSNAYFHGHSVGGTNPSLLEAMASSTFIIAHDNVFNRSVLRDSSVYFCSEKDIEEIVNNLTEYIEDKKNKYIEENLTKIRDEYSWERLVEQHEQYFQKLLKTK